MKNTTRGHIFKRLSHHQQQLQKVVRTLHHGVTFSLPIMFSIKSSDLDDSATAHPDPTWISSSHCQKTWLRFFYNLLSSVIVSRMNGGPSFVTLGQETFHANIATSKNFLTRTWDPGTFPADGSQKSWCKLHVAH